MSKEAKPKKGAKFSKQETIVFYHLIQEKKAHEISDIMGIDEKTVSTYKRRLHIKTDTKTIIGLYKFNIANKIVDI